MTDLAMPYRRLGRCRLQLSLLSLGSWVTYHNQVDVAAARETLAAAPDAGINFFDNAEVYANGRSEATMAQSLRELARSRLSDVVSIKFFWGLDRAKAGERTRIDAQDTLNRKILMQAPCAPTRRRRSKRPRAINDIIAAGMALYWGPSASSAADVRAAWDSAEQHHWHKPVVAQPQYHRFHRSRVERSTRRCTTRSGLV